MPNRVVRAANRNPFLTSLIFSALIFTVGLTAFKIQSQRTIDRVAAEATERREQLAAELANAQKRADEKLAASQLDVCQRAVTAVTNRLNSDLLKITGSFEAEGRPTPAWALQLELIISNQQPPLEACVPKENP